MENKMSNNQVIINLRLITKHCKEMRIILDLTNLKLKVIEFNKVICPEKL